MKKKNKDLNFIAHPGDAFVVPLDESVSSICVASTQSHLFAFGNVFFDGSEVKIDFVDSNVINLNTLRLITGSNILKGKWPLLGNIDIVDRIPLINFRIGSRITSGGHKVGNFIDVSSVLVEDPYSFEHPTLSIYPDEFIIRMLKSNLETIRLADTYNISID